MKLKELLDIIKAEITEQLVMAERKGDQSNKHSRSALSRKNRPKGGKGRNAGGSNAVKALSKGTVGKKHNRKLNDIPARDGKAKAMFDKVAKGGKPAARTVRQAQKLKGAEGNQWPAGVWAIATDQTIDKKVPKGGGKKGASPGAAKASQKKAVASTGKGSGKTRRTFKPTKTSKDKRQLDLFKKKK